MSDLTPQQIIYFFQQDAIHQPNPTRADVYSQTWKIIEQQQQRITELENKLTEAALNELSLGLQADELSATVERLREAVLAVICIMPSGKVKADLRDAYDATPQQNLNAVKREEFESFQQWALDFVCSPDFEPLKRRVFRKLNSGAQGQQVMPHNDPEYCGLLALLSQYANTKYPTGE